MRPEVLAMDHYPLMRLRATRARAILTTLPQCAHSLASRVPFWNFFYSMPFNDRLDPTEAQMRWQIYATLAYGGKGVLYFCYWTPGKGAGGAGEFPKGGAIITAEGRKTRHYDEARRMNAELKAMGPTLMQLTSTAVVRVKPDTDAASALKGTALKSIAAVPGDPPADYLIGAFRHADGRGWVLINNYSHTFTAWLTPTSTPTQRTFSKWTRQPASLSRPLMTARSRRGSGFARRGDGRLFILP